MLDNFLVGVWFVWVCVGLSPCMFIFLGFLKKKGLKQMTEDKMLVEAATEFVKKGPQKGLRRIAVVGSREGISYEIVKTKLEVVLEHYFYNKSIDIVIVSGGARGVDSHAYNWAMTEGVPVAVFKADWNTYGKSAGMRRNADIIQNSDVVIAFWDGVSPGTRNSIQRARIAGKKLYVFNERGEKV
jgi:hypothetical protein